MIGLDTNILVRWLVDDGTAHPETERAAELMQEASLHVSTVVMAETMWVLAKVYEKSRAEIAKVVKVLLEISNLTVEAKQQVQLALDRFVEHRGDFNDHLLAAHDEVAGCSHTATFDRIAARSPRFRLLRPPPPSPIVEV